MIRDAAGLMPVLLMAALAGGCATARQQQQPTAASERNMTLGVVQKEIRIGMSQADVATALGAPNIVTRDSAQLETWVYDRMATEVTYSREAGGGLIAGLLIGPSGAGAGAAGGSRQSGSASSSQRTLTVVIRFDARGLVQSTRYHASSF